MSNQPQFELGYIKPADHGKNYLAMLGFIFKPGGLYPVKVKDNYQDNSGNWKSSETIVINGAQSVEVKRAFLRRSEKGDFYVQCDIDLDWNLSKAIGDAAAARLEERTHEEAA